MHPIGTRVKVIQDIDVYPTTYIKAGETGTVSERNSDCIYVKLDAPHPELTEWDNAVEIWDWSDAEHPEWKPDAYLMAI
jgi:hypothetical protein